MGGKKYIGIVLFIIGVIAVCAVAYTQGIQKSIKAVEAAQNNVNEVQQTLDKKRTERDTIAQKLKDLKNSMLNSQKRIYSPSENFSDDKNDTLFFALYSDVMEMLHANSIKIKSIDYKYNPNDDIFTKQGSMYFVCDINMDIVSNYVNLGKLIQDLYQYPYYIKINQVDVKPYPKDKKILLSKLSLRLYAHTEPEDANAYLNDDSEESGIESSADNATTPLPQE